MVLQGLSPHRSCIKQLRMHHDRYQSSLRFPGPTNVGHEPSYACSTLDGLGCCDLKVFAQILDACFPLNFMLFDLLSVTSKAPVFSGSIFKPLLSNQRFMRHRLSLILSSRIPTSSAAHTTSASSAKPMMLVPAGSSKRRKSAYMTFNILVKGIY